jgi:predicted GTPase
VKSSLDGKQFINLASGANFSVGHGLASCTAQVQMAPSFQLGDRTVNLIDTPGFDDTDKSDAEVLEEIAAYLEKR